MTAKATISMNAKKPNGFGKVGPPMRKLVKVPPEAIKTPHLTDAQRTVLARLVDGWTLDRYGKNSMQGYMIGRRDENAVVSAKTVSTLFDLGLITSCMGRWTDFEISAAGKEALKK